MWRAGSANSSGCVPDRPWPPKDATLLDTLETLRGMIAEKFEVAPERVQRDATLETLGLDSLAVFDLIFDIESAFDIKVENDQVKIATVGDVVDLVERLRQEQGKV